LCPATQCPATQAVINCVPLHNLFVARPRAIPPCQAIRVHTKTDFMSKGSIRHLSPITKSGLNIRLCSDRLIWIHFALQLPSKTPLFPKNQATSQSTEELWEITMLPSLEAIRSCSPPCASTGFLMNVDPVTLQWRSFRRGGCQAMRRAGVPKTVRHYMMRWEAKNVHRSRLLFFLSPFSPTQLPRPHLLSVSFVTPWKSSPLSHSRLRLL
jgi:hypothetical protein